MARKYRLHRDRVRVRVDVEAGDRGRRLGHLVDLSMGGLCLSGPREALERFTGGPLTLRLPWTMAGCDQVELEVERSWIRQQGAARAHAGCLITRCDEGFQQALEHLVAGFSEPGH